MDAFFMAAMTASVLFVLLLHTHFKLKRHKQESKFWHTQWKISNDAWKHAVEEFERRDRTREDVTEEWSRPADWWKREA